MYKEDIIDIMSEAIAKSNEDLMRYQGMNDKEISEQLNWNRPALDYANEMVLDALIANGVVSKDTVE
jgi:hypothetical protein